MSRIFKTDLGELFCDDCEDYFRSKHNESKKADLIFTSPPFPLNRKKAYGNLNGSEYIQWISRLSTLFAEKLSDTGSLVIEIGNAWNSKEPTFSTLPIETLLAIKESGKFHLCQEFIHYNPAKLPSPIQWVNIDRIRVKDAFTRFWWLSKTTKPYACNSNVLQEYSNSMKKLLKSGKYNSGKRPSEHDIGSDSFLNDKGGAIPSNVIIASNTRSKDNYINYCKSNNLILHPARMALELPLFFIKFLTKENQLVLDPFAGSNMTGYVAEKLKRRWISIERNKNYAESSIGRFANLVSGERK